MRKTCLVSRFWGQSDADRRRLLRYATAIAPFGPVRIAINVAADNVGAKAHLETLQQGLSQGNPNADIVGIEVAPWGRFVPALNALVQAAVGAVGPEGAMFISSLEYVPTLDDLTTLHSHLDDATIVVGGVCRGHHYVRGYQGSANGRQTPWNTFALWNLRLLLRTGYALVGDGDYAPNTAAEEEFVTIANLQQLAALKGHTLSAKLVLLGEPKVPDMGGWSEERVQRHLDIIAGKEMRAESHRSFADAAAPIVQHL